MINYDWCVSKREELLAKYDYKGLRQYERELYESAYGGEDGKCKDFVACVILGVITDIIHSDYYEQFREDYPNILFGKQLPFYVRKEPSANNEPRKRVHAKPSEPNHGSEQIKLF